MAGSTVIDVTGSPGNDLAKVYPTIWTSLAKTLYSSLCCETLVALGYNILKNVVLLGSNSLNATIPSGTSAGVYDVWVVQPNMQFAVKDAAFALFDPSWYSIYLPIVSKND